VTKRPRLRLVSKGERDATSIFDDMEKLRADLDAVAAVTPTPPMAPMTNAGQAATSRRKRETETFARIPHKRGLELYRHVGGPTWAVLIGLDRMILAGRGKNPVTFWSRRLNAAGLTAGARRRALRPLEAVGVLEIEWRKQGLSPRVRHLWYPRLD
jgi:hypothetical protein